MPDNRDERREHHLNGEERSPKPPPPSTALTYAAGAGSDRGKKRWSNEDSILAASSRGKPSPFALPCGLFVVADGTGGYHDGQEASCSAIQAMVDALWPRFASFNRLEPEACTIMLSEAVQKANQAVHQLNSDLENRIETVRTEDEGGLNTKLTAAMLVGSTASVANVGDCRTYLYRAQAGLAKVTTDHLIVARWIEEGVLTPEQLYTHPRRNLTYRALPTQPQAEVDLFTVSLHPGDVLLLCTRSLWQEVRDPEIEAVIRSAPSDPSQVASTLIQTALERSDHDNVSAIVVTVREEPCQMSGPGIQLIVSPDRLHLPQS
jgi:serine/threonine protein phosphatase PrpC